MFQILLLSAHQMSLALYAMWASMFSSKEHVHAWAMCDTHMSHFELDHVDCRGMYC